MARAQDLPGYGDADHIDFLLDEVELYSRQLREAAESRDDAIRRARKAGASLRKVAARAGLSHEGIQKICARTTGG